MCGVVTGDIVGSSDLPQNERRALYDTMREAGQLVEEHFAVAIALPVDIFAGDTWQILLSDPPTTLRVATFYRSIIRSQMTDEGRDRKLDTRLVMAIGPIDFVPAQRTSEGEGEAFRLSGRGLKDLDKHTRMAFHHADASQARVWDTIARLLDAIITGQWTAARARALTGALLSWTQLEIAELWPDPIRQATVSTHLRDAAWPAIESAIKAFEESWR